MKKINKNLIKPLIEKYNLNVKDHWTTEHVYPGNKSLTCYYYVFVLNGHEYCVSGDSESYVFSTTVSILYMGYSLSDLEKAIQNIAQAS